MNTTICLCMIVKNEKERIEECLKHCIQWIDGWYIVDTGSTDGTQDMIKQYLKDKNGQLIQSEWIHFSYNRNEYLHSDFVKMFDYILIIDADELLHITNLDWKQKLTKDIYNVKICETSSQTHNWYPICMNTRILSNIEYQGVTHETIRHKNNDTLDTVQTHDIYILHNAKNNQSLMLKNTKVERDIALLTNELHKDNIDPIIKFQYLYYLYVSYDSLNNYSLATKCYNQLISHAKDNVVVDDEHLWYASYRYALSVMRLNINDEKWIHLMWNVYKLRPTRSEPLGCLMSYYNMIGDYENAKYVGDIAINIRLPINDVVCVSNYEYDILIPEQYNFTLHKINQMLT